MTPTPTPSSVSPRCNCPCACSRTATLSVRALAVGSLLGIASWAFLYVLGGALSWSAMTASGGASALTKLCVGVYGALAASLALGVGAFSAARVGGARTRQEAFFYGASLWSMATITLVITVLAASQGLLASLSSEASAVVEVGLAAVGMQMKSEGVSSPMGVLSGMVATMAVSLPFAMVAARRGLAPAHACCHP